MIAMQAAQRLVTDYRPGEPHGWPGGRRGGSTVGGHLLAAVFVHNGLRYRIELCPLAYAAAPSVDFVHHVEAAFGARYVFRYAGGLPADGSLRVRSYSAFATGAPPVYGADLYAVYEGDPDPARALRWIQVVRPSSGPVFVDNGGRANPFLPTGGPTSVNGRRLVNLYSVVSADPPAATTDLTCECVAEVFLAHDTGVRDRSGYDTIVVTGGLRYGWRATLLLPQDGGVRAASDGGLPPE
jgi:hypothetical protein